MKKGVVRVRAVYVESARGHAWLREWLVHNMSQGYNELVVLMGALIQYGERLASRSLLRARLLTKQAVK